MANTTGTGRPNLATTNSRIDTTENRLNHLFDIQSETEKTVKAISEDMQQRSKDYWHVKNRLNYDEEYFAVFFNKVYLCLNILGALIFIKLIMVDISLESFSAAIPGIIDFAELICIAVLTVAAEHCRDDMQRI